MMQHHMKVGLLVFGAILALLVCSSTAFEVSKRYEYTFKAGFTRIPMYDELQGFKSLKGITPKRQAIQRSDKVYIREKFADGDGATAGTGVCFKTPQLTAQARTHCQLCSVFMSTAYTMMFKWLFQQGFENHPPLAVPDSSKDAPGDPFALPMKLNEQYFEKLDPRKNHGYLYNARSNFIGARNRWFLKHVVPEVQKQVCTDESVTIFGTFDYDGNLATPCRDEDAGCTWTSTNCEATVMGLAKQLVAANIPVAFDRGCNYEMDGTGEVGITSPLECPVRTLCSCLARCPKGGTVGQHGCFDNCACKANAAGRISQADAKYYEDLWRLLHISHFEIPRPDRKELERQVAGYERRLQSKLARKETLDEELRALMAKLKTLSVEENEVTIETRKLKVTQGPSTMDNARSDPYKCRLVSNKRDAYPGSVRTSPTVKPSIKELQQLHYPSGDDESKVNCESTPKPTGCDTASVQATLGFEMECDFVLTTSVTATVDVLQEVVTINDVAPKWNAYSHPPLPNEPRVEGTATAVKISMEGGKCQTTKGVEIDRQSPVDFLTKKLKEAREVAMRYNREVNNVLSDWQDTLQILDGDLERNEQLKNSLEQAIAKAEEAADASSDQALKARADEFENQFLEAAAMAKYKLISRDMLSEFGSYPFTAARIKTSVADKSG